VLDGSWVNTEIGMMEHPVQLTAVAQVHVGSSHRKRIKCHQSWRKDTNTWVV